MRFRQDDPNNSSFYSKIQPLKQESDENHLTHNNPSPKNIKVLVEIVNSKFDFNMSKEIKMSDRISEIINIKWESFPVDYKINLSTKVLWASSKLNAQITYTKKNDTNVHLQNIHIPWKKTCNFDYQSPPIPPKGNEENQYQFTSQKQEENTTTHFEQIIYHNDHPILDIISTKVVTTKYMNTKNMNLFLVLDMNCEISYRIFQNQIIKIGPFK